MNVSAIMQDRYPYAGAYDGKVYQQDKSGTTNDASESSAAVNSFWRSGWLNMGEMIKTKHVQYSDLNFPVQSSGTFIYAYGYDFSSDRKSETISLTGNADVYGTGVYGVAHFGGQSDRTKMIHMKGNGKFFQYLVKNANAGEAFSFNGMEIPIKEDAPLSAR